MPPKTTQQVKGPSLNDLRAYATELRTRSDQLQSEANAIEGFVSGWERNGHHVDRGVEVRRTLATIRENVEGARGAVEQLATQRKARRTKRKYTRRAKKHVAKPKKAKRTWKPTKEHLAKMKAGRERHAREQAAQKKARQEAAAKRAEAKSAKGSAAK
jgi:hypothetical protein